MAASVAVMAVTIACSTCSKSARNHPWLRKTSACGLSCIVLIVQSPSRPSLAYCLASHFGAVVRKQKLLDQQKTLLS